MPVLFQCSLNAWLKGLASGDQRRLTGSGSALEVCLRQCTVQIHSLLYFFVNIYPELKDTCMVPGDAGESSAVMEPSYTFTTECFFMTHHTLALGFRVLHERLVQLNRELHRIQEVYRDVTQQGAADSEPAQRLKDDMERSM